MYGSAARLLLGLCIALFAARALSAKDAKPDVSINKKYVDISVTVDPAVKPVSGLFENCLTEGKTWAAKMENTATAEWRSNPSAFRDGMGWNYDRNYDLRSIVGHYASVVRSDSTFEGGAHPNQEINTILWDSTVQKRISIRPFFTETADNGPTMTALAKLASLAVAAEKLKNGINGYADNDDTPASKMKPEQELQKDQFIRDGIKPALLGVGAVTLAPSTESGRSSGLTFHYSPYAVGPYVEGPHTVFVPWTAFQQYLSADGNAIFGGARPPADEKDWEQ